ncbi:uncharacterized protein LOC144435978 [Glandiceps talaboti]
MELNDEVDAQWAQIKTAKEELVIKLNNENPKANKGMEIIKEKIKEWNEKLIKQWEELEKKYECEIVELHTQFDKQKYKATMAEDGLKEKMVKIRELEKKTRLMEEEVERRQNKHQQEIAQLTMNKDNEIYMLKRKEAKRVQWLHTQIDIYKAIIEVAEFIDWSKSSDSKEKEMSDETAGKTETGSWFEDWGIKNMIKQAMTSINIDQNLQISILEQFQHGKSSTLFISEKAKSEQTTEGYKSDDDDDDDEIRDDGSETPLNDRPNVDDSEEK